MRHGAFPAISVNKDVIVISDSSPPGHSGRRRLPVIWQHEAAATPYARRTENVKNTGYCPQIAEMHMKRMISVSPNSFYLPILEKS